MADTGSALIDAIADVERMIAGLTARRAELIDHAREWSEVSAGVVGGVGSGATPSDAADAAPDPASDRARRAERGWSAAIVARRELTSELACALRIPERTAERLVHESGQLIHTLPGSYEALGFGRISYRHAQSVIDHAAGLDDALRAEFEAAVLPLAETLTVAQFDRRARMQRERLDPEGIAERQRAAVAERRVDFQPARDGMAWLSAYLSAEQALAIHTRVTAQAWALRRAGDPRTLAQLRADLLASLAIGRECRDGASTTGDDRDGASLTGSATGGADVAGPGAGGGSATSSNTPTDGIRARVLVTVPVLSVLGHSDEPAMLEGYGPIDIETAKRLASGAPSFTRLLTHPETGAVLSVGRDRYAVPADLRTWLRVRDGTCRFPGCSKAAMRCDVDHVVDWQFGGETDHDNLAHLCPEHHHLKHHTAWAVRSRDGGVLDWTSPLGRTYTTLPATTMAPGSPRAQSGAPASTSVPAPVPGPAPTPAPAPGSPSAPGSPPAPASPPASPSEPDTGPCQPDRAVGPDK